MKAGKLRERITVYRPTDERDGYGEKVRGWTEVGTWHAEREAQANQLTDEAAEHFPDYRVTFRVRLTHRPEEHWMVEDADGKRYDIIGVERRRGLHTWDSYVRMKCDRINP